jgi:hypothetical protein
MYLKRGYFKNFALFRNGCFLFQKLAEFHAATYSLFGDGDGNQMLIKFPDVTELFFRKDGDSGISKIGQLTLHNTCKEIVQVLQEENQNELIPKIVHYLKEYAVENVLNLIAIPEEFPSVINHGDLWTNNVMFKYDSEGMGRFNLESSHCTNCVSRV